MCGELSSGYVTFKERAASCTHLTGICVSPAALLGIVAKTDLSAAARPIPSYGLSHEICRSQPNLIHHSN